MANHKSTPMTFMDPEKEKQVNHEVRSVLHAVIKALPYVQIGSLILYKTASIILANLGDDHDPDPDSRNGW